MIVSASPKEQQQKINIGGSSIHLNETGQLPCDICDQKSFLLATDDDASDLAFRYISIVA